jgi:hypothetical protein
VAISRHLSIAQTGSNFENFNFVVVFRILKNFQKSKMLNLSYTIAHYIHFIFSNFFDKWEWNLFAWLIWEWEMDMNTIEHIFVNSCYFCSFLKRFFFYKGIDSVWRRMIRNSFGKELFEILIRIESKLLQWMYWKIS